MVELDKEAMEKALLAYSQLDKVDTSHRGHMEAAIRAYLEAAGMTWRPISEAPKDGTQVIILFPKWCGGDARIARWIRHDDASHDGWEGIYGYAPTHFMPLPASPKETK